MSRSVGEVAPEERQHALDLPVALRRVAEEPVVAAAFVVTGFDGLTCATQRGLETARHLHARER